MESALSPHAVSFNLTTPNVIGQLLKRYLTDQPETNKVHNVIDTLTAALVLNA